ncbi:hypothetical protein O7627_08920 [Solwaraspora sp. WMMD1047]|uniref:hypothetical protein n=1 Tax=Solwaraspora sp. WMMD1047 TaxID=3016102 RepID=UPI002416A6E0|nr:hypothetical protein [Solwaraspora sp. WMMD1047]MDG4829425.1 hypothetical protein [Solwaraspora sp. WMMD1047]
MSFDLVVFAMGPGASSADVRAAHERCRQVDGDDTGIPEPQIASFYLALTADFPDRATPTSPWAVSPIHVGSDHVEMNLVETCPDAVLLAIERLAGEHGLQLLDLQDGTVYPPPARVTN